MYCVTPKFFDDSVPKISFSNIWIVFQFLDHFPIYLAPVNTILAQGLSFCPVQTLDQSDARIKVESSIGAKFCWIQKNFRPKIFLNPKVFSNPE